MNTKPGPTATEFAEAIREFGKNIRRLAPEAIRTMDDLGAFAIIGQLTAPLSALLASHDDAVAAAVQKALQEGQHDPRP